MVQDFSSSNRQVWGCSFTFLCKFSFPLLRFRSRFIFATWPWCRYSYLSRITPAHSLFHLLCSSSSVTVSRGRGGHVSPSTSMWSSAREKAFSSFPLFRLPSYHHLLLLRCTLYNDRSRQIAMQLSNSIQQYGSSSITIIFDAVLLTFQGIPHSLFELVSSGLSFSYHLTNLSCISFALSLSLFYSRIIPIARWLVFSACVVLSTTTSCLFALFSFGW